MLGHRYLCVLNSWLWCKTIKPEFLRPCERQRELLSFSDWLNWDLLSRFLWSVKSLMTPGLPHALGFIISLYLRENFISTLVRKLVSSSNRLFHCLIVYADAFLASIPFPSCKIETLFFEIDGLLHELTILKGFEQKMLFFPISRKGLVSY